MIYNTKKLMRLGQKVPDTCKSCAVYMQINSPNANYHLKDGRFVREVDVLSEDQMCMFVKSIFDRLLIDNNVIKQLDKCTKREDRTIPIGLTKKGVKVINYISDYVSLHLKVIPTLENIMTVISDIDVAAEVSVIEWNSNSAESYGFAVVQIGEMTNQRLLRRICDGYKNIIQS